MSMIVGVIAGICLSAAFPGPASVIRSMVAYCWTTVVGWFKSKTGG